MAARLALCLAAAALLVPAAAGAAPVAVVAAENVYGDVAGQIGGSNVAVTSILSNPDEDPHLFETNPSNARALAGAAVVIDNGVDYDPWMDKLIAASPKAGRTVITAAGLVGAKSGDNPHLWYDPRVLPAVAKALAADLSRRDPAHASEYKRNLDAFEASFKPVTAAVAMIAAAHRGTKVTATEPVFGLMLRALGFTVLNEPFQIAMMNNTEPSASQVAGFEQSLKDGSARILFYNSQVTDKATERLRQVAEAAHVPVVGVTETEPKGETVQSWFTGQLGEVERVLSGKPGASKPGASKSKPGTSKPGAAE